MSMINNRMMVIAALALAVMAGITLLVLNIFVLQRVVYLDRFFSTVSEDYRAIRGSSGDDDGVAVTTAEEGGGRICVSIDLDLESDPFIGDPNAPVVIVEYSDFECPFCARYYEDAYLLIKERYIDTGLARLYYKDFPLDNIHPLARPASIAANCLYEQRGSEAFFALHDQFFELGGQLGSVENIQRLMTAAGGEGWEACLNDPRYDEEIDADIDEGAAVGVTGTPSFVINGELVIGALPFGEFERVIEDALAGEGCTG